jgi:ATP-dependent helicase HrpA
MMRLEKWQDEQVRDATKMKDVQRFVTLYEREIVARKGVADERLTEFRWLIEELRVSLFAQKLRTPMPVSVKRLEKVWNSLLY